MSTATVTTITGSRSKQKRITVAAVRTALEDIARLNPGRVDRRSDDETPARYVEWDRPACLVARVLERLGYGIGILKALDAEHAVGELCLPGVRVADSRHPAISRLDDNAKALLQWVQDRQDEGRMWGRIVADAFKARTVFTLARWDRERRPWLYG